MQMTDIETYGCALNQADSEILAGILKEAGLSGLPVVIVNTCTVKSPTESKILRRMHTRGAALRL
jgi:threonylcarbamoyladenosine tRNA methylthiotransferase CDKAL1